MGLRGPIAGAENAGRPPNGGNVGSNARRKLDANDRKLITLWCATLRKKKYSPAKVKAFREVAERAAQWRGLEPQDFAAIRRRWTNEATYEVVERWLHSIDGVTDIIAQGEKGSYIDPKFTIWQSLQKVMQDGDQRFGQSPGDRARLGDKKPADAGASDEDEYAKFMADSRDVAKGRRDEPTGGGDDTQGRRAVSRSRAKRAASRGKTRTAGNRKASARSK